MSLILRFSKHLPIRFPQTPKSPLVFQIGSHRSFGQTARIEDEEIDQRYLPTNYDAATFDPTEHRNPPTNRVFKLVNEISSLTLSEISQLSSIIMKKKGITDSPTVSVMIPRASGLGQNQSDGGGVNEEAKVEKARGYN